MMLAEQEREGHDALSLHPECWEQAKRELQEEVDSYNRAFSEMLEDMIAHCFALRDEYLAQCETRCPACGRIVRVEMQLTIPRIYLVDPHRNRMHECAFLPVSINQVDAGNDNLRARGVRSTPPALGVEVLSLD
jgi:hypothetical protein